jgi:regulator of protease activity HflC (stomatin/prohibitin superfamily)
LLRRGSTDALALRRVRLPCPRAAGFQQSARLRLRATCAIQIVGIIGIAVILYLFGSLRVLRQYERGVVFFLGRFEGVRGPGITLIFAPIQQMVRVSLRTVTMQIPSQKIITKDNVSIDIAAVAYYHISDPEKAVL